MHQQAIILVRWPHGCSTTVAVELGMKVPMRKQGRPSGAQLALEAAARQVCYINKALCPKTLSAGMHQTQDPTRFTLQCACHLLASADCCTCIDRCALRLWPAGNLWSLCDPLLACCPSLQQHCESLSHCLPHCIGTKLDHAASQLSVAFSMSSTCNHPQAVESQAGRTSVYTPTAD